MRPVRLQLSGFTAYRDPVEVDFTDADLFALCGATGSGKTSLLDAMCFALYGSVPRLDRRAVAPIVAVGRPEARVRFDFTVGERRYSAARVVRRTATGATTKEARLECGEEVLAGDAEGVSKAVERVLGLGFDQFTKCVVLPQGDFARFLHDKPSDRQELLVKLLDLRVYERMRSEANLRAKSAEDRGELLAQQLTELAAATPQALDAARQRVEVLQGLRDDLDAVQAQIDRLTLEVKTLTADQAASQQRLTTLGSIAVPSEVEALTAQVAQAEQEAAQAESRCESAAAAVEVAERERAVLGDQAQLLAIQDRRQQHATLLERHAKGDPVVIEYQRAERDALADSEKAEAALQSARSDLEQVRRRDMAASLARTLAIGDTCPVCAQTIAEAPHHDVPAAARDAEAAVAAAQEDAKKAAAHLEERRGLRLKAEQRLESVLSDIESLSHVLAGAPTLDQIASQLQRIAAADAAMAAARKAEREATVARKKAAEAAGAARSRVDEAWRRFDQARDAVAALGPPAVTRENLGAAWTTLHQWAQQEAARQRDAAARHRRQLGDVESQLQSLGHDVRRRCESAGVVVNPNIRARDAVADTLATAISARDRIAADVERAQRLRLELTGHRQRATVARALGQHLAANGFERWLLDEALQRLAGGATGVLHDLSGGQYSLELDSQHNFAVVDHRNADERRSARTLSGGETFLASLSLALTLAEHLAELAVDARPRLESVFLDEGFGTLDPETLDVVAAAIEELGARGRTVGVVTHVRDLADRLPVRFEVRRGPAGATVQRLEVG